MNRVGETVVFNQNLNIDFDANLIDFLKVYNPSTKDFTKSEHWGWEEEKDGLPFYDFGIIGDWDFVITKEKTTFYFGDSPIVCYDLNDPERLIVLPRGTFLLGDLIEIGTFNFYKEYPSPKTMLDLANFIDNYLFERIKHKLILQNEHKRTISFSKLYKSKNKKKENDDLPF